MKDVLIEVLKLNERSNALKSPADMRRLVHELRERTGLTQGAVCLQTWRHVSHNQPQEGFETLGASTVQEANAVIAQAPFFDLAILSIARVMAPDGYLVIGSTESITGLCPEFESKRYLRAVFYQLRNGG
jgi:hypothetical protein